MNYTIYPNDLLEEIDLYDQLIEKAGSLLWLTPPLLQTLTGLRDDRIATLDELTRPPRKSIRDLIAEKIARHNFQLQNSHSEPIRIGYKYDNKFNPCTCCLNIWRKLLKELWEKHPERRNDMAVSVRRFGYNRSYISNDKKNLFVGKTDRWIRQHSKELFDGWYIDTNVTPERIHKILPTVVTSAGLKWEKDVVVIWN